MCSVLMLCSAAPGKRVKPIPALAKADTERRSLQAMIFPVSYPRAWQIRNTWSTRKGPSERSSVIRGRGARLVKSSTSTRRAKARGTNRWNRSWSVI